MNNWDITHLSTFKLKSTANTVIDIKTVAELKTTVEKFKNSSKKFHVIGGGSNTLLSEVVKKPILRIQIDGISYQKSTGSTVGKIILAKAGAGVTWDVFVLDTICKGLTGLETLSAIPGTVGATPIQNVGAYGSEVSETIESIEVFEISTGKIKTISNRACRFSYRMSRFKDDWAGKYIVLSVTFALRKAWPITPVYPGVLEKIKVNQPGVASGTERITGYMIRNAVIEIRKSKLPDLHTFPNVGSFFHNPIVLTAKAAALKKDWPNLPVFDNNKTTKKLSAGWLIDQAGWKGKKLGKVSTHEHNALVLVNTGKAKLQDVLKLQKKIEEAVWKKFKVKLIREPRVLN